jgi:hypothetical protein
MCSSFDGLYPKLHQYSHAQQKVSFSNAEVGVCLDWIAYVEMIFPWRQTKSCPEGYIAKECCAKKASQSCTAIPFDRCAHTSNNYSTLKGNENNKVIIYKMDS